MALEHGDLSPIEENLARRVIRYARTIAPVHLLEGEPKQDAVAILTAVAREIPAPGSRRVRSQGRNGTTISFGDLGAYFSAEDRDALRDICAAGTATQGTPLGSFPKRSAIASVWPEGEYS